MSEEDLQSLFVLAKGLYIMGCYMKKPICLSGKCVLQAHWNSGNNQRQRKPWY